MHHIFFGATKPEDLLPIDSVVSEIRKILNITKHYHGPLINQFDDATRKGLTTLI